MRGIGVGSPEKLAAAHLDNDRSPDTLKQAGLGAIADDPPSGDPLRKIPEGSLPRSNHLPVTERLPIHPSKIINPRKKSYGVKSVFLT